MWPFGQKRLESPGPMKLRLRDLVFDIDSATLGAGLADPYWAAKYDPKNPVSLNWSLAIECKDLEHDEEFWAPAVTYDGARPAVERWTDWAGQVIEWTRPFDKVTGKPNGSFYVFDHSDIRRSRIEFVSRRGLDFDIDWSGVCDVHWKGKYKTSVPFALRATATFTDIIVHANERDTEATVRERLSQHLKLDGLRQGPFEHSEHRYQDGVAMASCKFTPLLDS